MTEGIKTPADYIKRLPVKIRRVAHEFVRRCLHEQGLKDTPIKDLPIAVQWGYVREIHEALTETEQRLKVRIPLELPDTPITPPAAQLFFDPNKLVSMAAWDLHPHAAFFAPSGAGKDFTASKLLNQAEGRIIACLIKEPEMWRSHCPKAEIVCNGYDCAAIEQTLQMAVDLNEARVANGDRSPLTIVLSDYPSMVEKIEEITEKYIAKLLRDGRSNRIRLWFLLQEKNVSALKLEGRSELLQNLTILRGGAFATQYVLPRFAKKLVPIGTLNLIRETDRPWICNDLPVSFDIQDQS